MARSGDRTISSETRRGFLLGLGSNLGHREENLLQALEHLQAAGVRLAAISACYETAPQGGPPQANYLNLACFVEWSESPLELLDTCQEIERMLGRRRQVRWGPRTVDIDILLVGRRVIVTDRLMVPHPEFEKRAFVLVPSAEIAGDLIHPVSQKTISRLLLDLPTPAETYRHEWASVKQERIAELLSQGRFRTGN